MTDEVWLPVAGYEGLYEVSSIGRVRSLGRIVHKSNGSTQTTPAKILATQRRSGYLYVHLRSNKIGRHGAVHRLVCEAFNGPPKTGQMALHSDDVKDNNAPSNLRWGNNVDNAYDYIALGNHHEVNRTYHKCGRKYDKIIYWPDGRFRQRACSECMRTYSRERQRLYRHQRKLISA